ncbi:Scr1 family TA system antitoxin-like transcriptional regulator [Streptomyces sp. NPDC001812]|uniref:helix-turn-helix domain-containing protein n=1 Tax=Streptomyces sp. NPDC001812 TaxID=3364611 RepID=UPI003674E8A0
MSVEPYGADEESAAVLRTVGRVIKMCREREGMTQAGLGTAIRYSEEQVSSVERGRRAPTESFLEAADRVLDAGDLISGLKNDVEKARFPKKVRDLAELEAEAVEICAYDNSVVNGLLQTEEYLRAVFGSRRPAFSEDEVDRLVTARPSPPRSSGPPSCRTPPDADDPTTSASSRPHAEDLGAAIGRIGGFPYGPAGSVAVRPLPLTRTPRLLLETGRRARRRGRQARRWGMARRAAALRAAAAAKT